MKRIFIFPTLLLAILLTMVFSMATAQLAPLPDDPRFDQPVEFSTQVGGESLRAMIVALARSVNLTPIAEEVPDQTITYDIGEPKPFRQVWNIVLTLNDLDYVLLDNDVVVVGPSGAIAGLRDAPVAAAEPTEPGDQDVQRFYRVNNDPEQVVAIVQRAVPTVTVEALPGVQSIVVVGTEGEQDRVQTVLDQFDRAAEVIPLEQRIYQLSNAQASELAEVLRNTNIAVGAEGPEGAAEPVSQENAFSVTADPRTNSLIVTATPSIQARLAEIIPQLDEPQRQVNVQVRIQEISQRAATDLGIDLTASLGNFSSSILNTGLQFIFDTTEILSGLNIMAVLDTLESQGLSRRVDDTNLTMLNNEEGTFFSGGSVRVLVPTGDGTQVEEISFGVDIRVTPRISADGRIILDVAANVSQRIPATGAELLNLTERDVTSTVSLSPGQTVLLGGLLQNQFSLTENRVPILGSIPIIGGLFGTTEQTEESTELLLVVTATIIE